MTVFTFNKLYNIIPELCMKINVKFEKYLKTTVCENLESKENSQWVKRTMIVFILLIFTLRTSRRLPYAALLRIRSKELRRHP
jgi:hypothetical protein